jgi:hypothetical protein
MHHVRNVGNSVIKVHNTAKNIVFNLIAAVEILHSGLCSVFVIIMEAQLEYCNLVKQHSVIGLLTSECVTPVNIDFCIIAQYSSVFRNYRNVYRWIH